MKNFFSFFLFLFFSFNSFAFRDVSNCASDIFLNALNKDISNINENDPKNVIKYWIFNNFQKKEVLSKVLDCDNISNLKDDEIVKFKPFDFVFKTGRKITVEYTSQLKLLKNRLLLSNKKTDVLTSENILNSGENWISTNPAWYGIMVVQKDSLKKVLEGGNTVVSLKYIYNNIDNIYPKQCTSKTALADDNEIINITTHKTVSLKDDTNDYYVAGDANLQWISISEIALDVVITVLTVGGGAVVMGITKGARAVRLTRNLITTAKTLEKIDKVQDWIKLERAFKDSSKVIKDLKKLKKLTDTEKDLLKLKKIELEKLAKEMKELEKIKDVEKYKNVYKNLNEINKLRKELNFWKVPQRGNIIARTIKGIKAFNSAEKVLSKGTKAYKAGRTSTISNKLRDFIFRSTLKTVNMTAKAGGQLGAAREIIKIAGDMYDWTNTATGEFTSGVEFSPFCLLSADDLKGQENVINYGMWLLWMGDNTDINIDDAAYLQALDFANKFHQDLIETEEEKHQNCNLDIFVVKPIIKNPNNNPELYYLIMNDIPWQSR